ncbi:MAG TPA: 4-hydroxy-3-methylbut-2-enyl diphosphate reductase, partial [Candidatus Acetothermia bacterium]|nr:4-hydroxy-3-methylbut-2-enyl diphosphate reductase [Candidatus Acetothermia bacterium]HEX32454.1 4-hydroxy-3-methylbut-2-enyl diphosphate reductase [Candidatus Acetothermia bacterium]
HVVESLTEKGGRLIHDLNEVHPNEAVAITAHGAGDEVYSAIRDRGLRIVDTTCPIVRRAQQTAEKLVKEGYFVIVYGEAEHPEVKGILSWTAGKGVATQTPEVEIPEGTTGIAVIAQTTKNPQQFAQFAERATREFAGKVTEIRIVNTTCPETGRRYQAGSELAKRVDVILVVGSRSSANTRKLAETCSATGVPTYHIESASEIKEEWFDSCDVCGVTAGASTPDEVIENVVNRLNSKRGE